MKKKYEEWRKLTGGNGTSSSVANPEPILVNRLPYIHDVESKLLLNPPKNGVLPPTVGDYVDWFSSHTFGITENDTLFDAPDHYEYLHKLSDERYRIEVEWEEHESRYETAEATDDEAVAILLKHGIDFRDDKGQPLRCTKFLCRQAEAAAKGIAGQLPDRTAINLDAWASKLEKEARLHMARKKRL